MKWWAVIPAAISLSLVDDLGLFGFPLWLKTARGEAFWVYKTYTKEVQGACLVRILRPCSSLYSRFLVQALAHPRPYSRAEWMHAQQNLKWMWFLPLPVGGAPGLRSPERGTPVGLVWKAVRGFAENWLCAVPLWSCLYLPGEHGPSDQCVPPCCHTHQRPPGMTASLGDLANLG